MPAKPSESKSHQLVQTMHTQLCKRRHRFGDYALTYMYAEEVGLYAEGVGGEKERMAT